MTDDELLALLRGVRTIAVVGASARPGKPSHSIPALMIEAGYTVVPVNPSASEILGRRAYPSLADVPHAIDVVDVFRPAEEAPSVAEQAVAIGARVLWLQLGITSPGARRIAESAGLTYLENICIGHTTRRLGAHPAG